METIEHGYFIVARKTFQSEVMDWSPVWFKLWIWLIGAANHQTIKSGGVTYNRGEILTSYDEMIEVASYKIGWRKMKPSKTVIRKFCEELRKTTMATTRKTTRGFLIKLVNYDIYQTQLNYEDQTKKNMKTTSRPQTGHTINNNEKQDIIINNDPPKSGNVENSVDKLPIVGSTGYSKKGIVDLKTILQKYDIQTLDKKKQLQEFQRFALEVAEKMKINFDDPIIKKSKWRMKWFSMFKTMMRNERWGTLNQAYSFCVDYNKPLTSEAKLKLFFWKIKQINLARKQS